MHTRAGLLCIALLFCLVTKVTCLTNAEFYDRVKDYATDIEIIEPNEESASYDDVDDDVIELPGGPDDMLDVEYLMGRLVDMTETSIEGQNVNGQGALKRDGCSCGRHYCQCCVSKTFKVKVWGHRLKFRLRACLKVELRRHGFEISFTINGHRVCHKEYSLKHSVSLCYRVPQFPAARICLNIYNINLRGKRACARLTGKVNLGYRRFKVHLKLGCFRLPFLTTDGLTRLSDNVGYSDLYEESLERLSDQADSHEELAYLDDDADASDLALEDVFQQVHGAQIGDEDSFGEFEDAFEYTNEIETESFEPSDDLEDY